MISEAHKPKVDLKLVGGFVPNEDPCLADQTCVSPSNTAPKEAPTCSIKQTNKTCSFFSLFRQKEKEI